MQSMAVNERKAEMPSRRTYRVNEIADLLGISLSSAYRLIKQGHFKTVRIGTSIRVSKQSFDEWLDRNTD